MRRSYKLALGSFAAASALSLLPEPTAHACGGCFVQQTESTQVTGHRMVLSVSKAQTTLYDQISYSGEPADFAWVLPIRGQVDIGLSSDALFAALETYTQVNVYSPQINCAPPPSCDDSNFSPGGATGAGGSSGGPVEVIAQEVVGPYETVQLHSTDPAALATWLADHGYNVPADVQPVIDAYIAEGFDFLALRLVPGQGIDSMRPVRVTSPGAGPALPLRMVAAGTGAITPISFWVIGEGRYVPQNFHSFQISEQELVWDWDAQRSNYSDLRSQGYAAYGGSNWLIEAGESLYPWAFDELLYTAENFALDSGYADDDGQNALANAQADIDTLLAGINPDSAVISHLSAELSRPALAADLTLQASTDQSYVQRTFYVQNATGTEPECPTYEPVDCGNGPALGGSGSGGGTASSQDGSLCTASPQSSVAAMSAPAALTSGLLFAWLVARRRRRAS
ncbi:MAG: DUF2330 domain-containing protein [Polyangiaceae bacterium]